VFSTSPGTIVYNLTGGPYAGRAAAFEPEVCGRSVVTKAAPGAEPISFKMSVNTRETSATFANSALIYYHFARYFAGTVHVPVAVLRTIDRAEHERRVSSRGDALSAGRSNLRQNHAAWLALRSAARNPSTYQPNAELFTADGQLYGVMLRPGGRRYGPEVNGTRQSGWGEGQNRDFQETAPFLALRSDQPLPAAVDAGVADARRSAALAKAMGSGPSHEQMVYWMSDLVDITLLDFILGQQDRIGNIDYVAYWHWRDGDRVRVRRASGSEPPADLVRFGPVYLKRTELGDNDAGVRTSYANFTRRTGMLEKLRHYRADTYRRLLDLNRDFRARGPLHEYVRTTFGLSDREFERVVANTADAATILKESCRAGRLRFDVEPVEFLLTGAVKPQEIPCDLP
jgi:hypothetical protein